MKKGVMKRKWWWKSRNEKNTPSFLWKLVIFSWYFLNRFFFFSQVFQMFDKVILLSQGEQVIFSPLPLFCSQEYRSRKKNWSSLLSGNSRIWNPPLSFPHSLLLSGVLWAQSWSSQLFWAMWSHVWICFSWFVQRYIYLSLVYCV